MNDALRLGLIYPGGGGEHEYYLFADRTERLAIYLAVSERGSSNGSSHAIVSLRETARITRLEAAARRLTALRLDAVMWACTSGSFIGGRRGAERQIRAIRRAAGAPAGSTSMAFIHALCHLAIRRVAVAATYPRPAAKLFVRFLAEFEIEAVGIQCLGVRDGYGSSRLSRRQIRGLVRKADRSRAQAIVVPDTALPTLDMIDELQSLVAKPVLTANQVTLWEGVRLGGGAWVDAGFGGFLSTAERRQLSGTSVMNR